MALFKFAQKIVNKEPIDVYNFGDMTRDFTYVDDVVQSISLLINHPPINDNDYDRSLVDPATSWCPFRILNIGNSNPSKLMDYIEALELSLGTTAVRISYPCNPEMFSIPQLTALVCLKLLNLGLLHLLPRA